MTVESLMNTFTQYVSWLYSEREWARWELQTVAITAMVLLLLILITRRKAKAKRIGISLGAGKAANQGFEGDINSRSIISISKNHGNRKRWKETTKKWKNYQKLIEQLQQEIAKYKKAEEYLEQQFSKLKATNEQLGHEITESGQVVQEPEMSRPRNIGSLGKQQRRILNPSGVLSENS